MSRADRIGLGIGLATGLPLMLVGVLGLVDHTDATPPRNYLTFLLGGNLLHDAIVAPAACVLGFVFVRKAPRIAHGPLRAALFTSAIAFAVAWPALRGYGRDRTADNLTVQPRNYATALWTVLAIVWTVAALWLVVGWARGRRRSRSDTVAV